ncbi:hypothetical protein B0T18DRAFT_433392 [Schizothecium vesticola]|uniref:Uncharacterized protein n=1 Tax=Schizothecium vesticola TaxID=314040 RepID=A0AA40BQL2_9PEZI|nr:hypothetical protein B0T18DRAFT_433392 [Schizothecium vesticola]
MASPESNHLADLSDESIDQLASLLCPQGLTTNTVIRDITQPLLSSGQDSSAAALLCPLHNAFNPLLLHHCLHLLQDECSSGLQALVAFLSRFDTDVLDSKRYAAIVLHHHVVPVLDSASTLCADVNVDCPACVLAAIGGRRDLLCALEASIRTRDEQTPAPLLRLVRAWITCAVAGDLELDAGGQGLRGRLAATVDVLLRRHPLLQDRGLVVPRASPRDVRPLSHVPGSRPSASRGEPSKRQRRRTTARVAAVAVIDTKAESPLVDVEAEAWYSVVGVTAGDDKVSSSSRPNPGSPPDGRRQEACCTPPHLPSYVLSFCHDLVLLLQLHPQLPPAPRSAAEQPTTHLRLPLGLPVVVLDLVLLPSSRPACLHLYVPALVLVLDLILLPHQLTPHQLCPPRQSVEQGRRLNYLHSEAVTFDAIVGLPPVVVEEGVERWREILARWRER